MSETGDLFGIEAEEASADSGELTSEDVELLRALDALYQASDRIAIKKLAVNDRSWAWTPPKSKQAGIYVPEEFRGGLFFPPDSALHAHSDNEKNIQLAISVTWPQAREHEKLAHYKRFTGKNSGSETHLTQLPKKLFSVAAPASLLVLGRTRQMPDTELQAVLVDSRSEVWSILEAKFSLRPDFLAGVFDSPAALSVPQQEEDELQRFIEEAVEAVETGTLHLLLKKYSEMPKPEFFSNQARQVWLDLNPRKTLNPMKLEKPGDVVRRIVSDIEFDLYQQYEVRVRGAKLITLLLGDGAKPTVRTMVTRLVRDFGDFYSEMLNAAQQRKARVGTGFETHIRSLLDAASLPYAVQKVVGSLRPDFVLPSVELYQSSSPDALVLSAKTTLRERWKQVAMEKRSCPIFLATMDEKVAVASVQKMREQDIYLVVPEAFKVKRGAVAEFAQESNVLTFGQFFREEIALRRAPLWT